MRFSTTYTQADRFFSSFFKEGYALRAERRAEETRQLIPVWFDSLSIDITPPTLAETVQENYYNLFGSDISDLAYYKSDTSEYLYNAKERQKELELYHYGARMYDPTIGRWQSMDPLADKLSSFSPYNFVLNNPLNFTDPDGRYPKPILIYDPSLGLYGGFRFTKSAAHLLSLVANMDRSLIENAIVLARAPGQYRPFYDSDEGGGAITLGMNGRNTITYTPNYFADDPKAHKGHGYGQNLYEWLKLSSHEVKHLSHIVREKALLNYLAAFAIQYIKAGNHDGAKYEKEADVGERTFKSFYSFIQIAYGKGSLEKLMARRSESTKIQILDKWWGEFLKEQATMRLNGLKSIIKSFSNAEEGTYVWDGSKWVRK